MASGGAALGLDSGLQAVGNTSSSAPLANWTASGRLPCIVQAPPAVLLQTAADAAGLAGHRQPGMLLGPPQAVPSGLQTPEVSLEVPAQLGCTHGPPCPSGPTGGLAWDSICSSSSAQRAQQQMYQLAAELGLVLPAPSTPEGSGLLSAEPKAPTAPPTVHRRCESLPLKPPYIVPTPPVAPATPAMVLPTLNAAGQTVRPQQAGEPKWQPYQQMAPGRQQGVATATTAVGTPAAQQQQQQLPAVMWPAVSAASLRQQGHAVATVAAVLTPVTQHGSAVAQPALMSVPQEARKQQGLAAKLGAAVPTDMAQPGGVPPAPGAVHGVVAQLGPAMSLSVAAPAAAPAGLRQQEPPLALPKVESNAVSLHRPVASLPAATVAALMLQRPVLSPPEATITAPVAPVAAAVGQQGLTKSLPIEAAAPHHQMPDQKLLAGDYHQQAEQPQAQQQRQQQQKQQGDTSRQLQCPMMQARNREREQQAKLTRVPTPEQQQAQQKEAQQDKDHQAPLHAQQAALQQQAQEGQPPPTDVEMHQQAFKLQAQHQQQQHQQQQHQQRRAWLQQRQAQLTSQLSQGTPVAAAPQRLLPRKRKSRPQHSWPDASQPPLPRWQQHEEEEEVTSPQQAKRDSSGTSDRLGPGVESCDSGAYGSEAHGEGTPGTDSGAANNTQQEEAPRDTTRSVAAGTGVGGREGTGPKGYKEQAVAAAVGLMLVAAGATPRPPQRPRCARRARSALGSASEAAAVALETTVVGGIHLRPRRPAMMLYRTVSAPLPRLHQRELEPAGEGEGEGEQGADQALPPRAKRARPASVLTSAVAQPRTAEGTADAAQLAHAKHVGRASALGSIAVEAPTVEGASLEPVEEKVPKPFAGNTTQPANPPAGPQPASCPEDLPTAPTVAATPSPPPPPPPALPYRSVASQPALPAAPVLLIFSQQQFLLEQFWKRQRQQLQPLKLTGQAAGSKRQAEILPVTTEHAHQGRQQGQGSSQGSAASGGEGGTFVESLPAPRWRQERKQLPMPVHSQQAQQQQQSALQQQDSGGESLSAGRPMRQAVPRVASTAELHGGPPFMPLPQPAPVSSLLPLARPIPPAALPQQQRQPAPQQEPLLQRSWEKNNPTGTSWSCMLPGGPAEAPVQAPPKPISTSARVTSSSARVSSTSTAPLPPPWLLGQQAPQTFPAARGPLPNWSASTAPFTSHPWLVSSGASQGLPAAGSIPQSGAGAASSSVTPRLNPYRAAQGGSATATTHAPIPPLLLVGMQQVAARLPYPAMLGPLWGQQQFMPSAACTGSTARAPQGPMAVQGLGSGLPPLRWPPGLQGSLSVVQRPSSGVSQNHPQPAAPALCLQSGHVAPLQQQPVGCLTGLLAPQASDHQFQGQAEMLGHPGIRVALDGLPQTDPATVVAAGAGALELSAASSGMGPATGLAVASDMDAVVTGSPQSPEALLAWLLRSDGELASGAQQES